MNILVYNVGTDSLRLKVINVESEKSLFDCKVEAISTSSSYISVKNYVSGEALNESFDGTFEGAIDLTFSLLTSYQYGIYKNIEEIEAVGHRVVNAGAKYTSSTLITPQVVEDIQSNSFLAPIHNPKVVKVIKQCYSTMKKQNEVAVFDTAFHNTIPDFNYRYAIPSNLYEERGIRKYGFHGISYQNIAQKLPKIFNKKLEEINVVIAHLGSGCSMCCVKNGKSYDTTMGFTPLDGLVMSSRSGSVDPSILIQMCDYYNCSLEEAINILNNESGYYAICGEKDIKTICDNSDNGDNKAMFARKVASQSFKKYLGSMLVELNSIDGIIITGGMGVKNYRQRELFLSDLNLIGVSIDKEKNKNLYNKFGEISSKNSKIKIYVVPSNEELEIAKESQKVLKEYSI